MIGIVELNSWLKAQFRKESNVDSSATSLTEFQVEGISRNSLAMKGCYLETVCKLMKKFVAFNGFQLSYA